MRRLSADRRVIIQIAVLTCLLTGCSSEPVELVSAHGQVTVAGVPVEQVAVMFVPVERGVTAAGGVTDVDGQYTLHQDGGEAGIQCGAYKVVFLMSNDVRRSAPRGRDRPDYSRPATTPFEATVSPGVTKFDFELAAPKSTE